MTNADRIRNMSNEELAELMADRGTEDHKIWLFNIAHSNLSEAQILQGFIKYYVLNGLLLATVRDDLVFRTSYGGIYVEQAMKDLKAVLEKAAAEGGTGDGIKAYIDAHPG